MTKDQKSKVLIIPMTPTPNGRMHIGHLAGPYLHADALARSLRGEGRSVLLCSGSDSYENWVLPEALARGESPSDTCNRNHQLISADFELLSVKFDLWVNPLNEEHRIPYAELHEDLVRGLIANGVAQLRKERVPTVSQTGRFAIGTWVTGRCPQCGATANGNSCVKCGSGFQPSELLDPCYRFGEDDLVWTEKHSWFIEPDMKQDVLRKLISAGVPGEFVSIAQAHLERVGTAVRLTQPGEWGIRSDLVEPDCLLANSFYAYCLYISSIASKLMGWRNSALDSADDHVTVVTLFGKDNAIAGLVTPYLIAAASKRYRAPDFAAVNHLLQFEGAKCSASKRHGLWVAEVIENTSLTGDELRYYLCGLGLHDAPADASVVGLVDEVNVLRSWKSAVLGPRLRFVSPDVRAELREAGQRAIDQQRGCLQPCRIDLRSARRVLENWMYDDTLTSASDHAHWLLTLTHLLQPIMPKLSLELTRCLEGITSYAAMTPDIDSGRQLTAVEIKDVASYGESVRNI